MRSYFAVQSRYLLSLEAVYTVGYYLIFIPMYWYTLGRGALRFMRAWERQSNNYSCAKSGGRCLGRVSGQLLAIVL